MSSSMCCEASDTNCRSASLTTAAALVAQLDATGAAPVAGPAQARTPVLSMTARCVISIYQRNRPQMRGDWMESSWRSKPVALPS